MSTGIVRTKVLSPHLFKKTFVVPDEISKLLIQNVGTDTACIWFDNEVMAEGFTVAPGGVLPTINVRANLTVINYQAVTLTFSKLELLFWD